MSAGMITLGCLLLDDDVAFEVSVAPSASVDSLRKAIKAELSVLLSSVDASTLNLWKVNVPYTGRASIKEKTLKKEDLMEPFKRVGFYFSNVLTEEHIHVVVRRPQARDSPVIGTETIKSLMGAVKEVMENTATEIVEHARKRLKTKDLKEQKASEISNSTFQKIAIDMQLSSIEVVNDIFETLPEMEIVPEFGWRDSDRENDRIGDIVEYFKRHLRLHNSEANILLTGSPDIEFRVSRKRFAFVAIKKPKTLSAKETHQAIAELLLFHDSPQQFHGLVVLTDCVETWEFFWLGEERTLQMTALSRAQALSTLKMTADACVYDFFERSGLDPRQTLGESVIDAWNDLEDYSAFKTPQELALMKSRAMLLSLRDATPWAEKSSLDGIIAGVDKTLTSITQQETEKFSSMFS
ncbi:hypothetical protein HDU93_003198 [Gonapodya sp. JEL0774]|nr:hypothetical protein HDU93_003198 [Gonapodya sp. JEL0774]